VYEGDGTTVATNQHVASPGQIVEFRFPVTTPWAQASGSYEQLFKPTLRDMGTDFSPSSLADFYVNVP
jgi:hypothetical protein